MHQQSESVKKVHDHKFTVRCCSRSTFKYLPNVSRVRQPYRQIVVDKIKGVCEPLLIERFKDSLNQFRFLLSSETIYLLVCKKRAYGYDEYLSDCRRRRELLPDQHCSNRPYGAWICTRRPS